MTSEPVSMMGAPTPPGGTAAPTLIIIDDEVNILRAVDRLMRGSCLRVLAFSEPAAAYPFFADPSVAVIISDFRMPLVTGTEVLARAKEDNRFARRILLSGFADGQGAVDAMKRRSIHHLINKPFDPALLRATILQNAADALFDTLAGRLPSLLRSLRRCTADAEVRALVSDGLAVIGADIPGASLEPASLHWNDWGQVLRSASPSPERDSRIVELLLDAATESRERPSVGKRTVREDGAAPLPDQRVFDLALGRERQRACRYGTPLSLAVLEVGGLRDRDRVDTVLDAAGGILRHNLRSIDLATRSPAAGFWLLLPGVAPAGARIVMERVTTLIRQWAAATAGCGELTTSVGISRFSREDADAGSLVTRADAALALVKEHGSGGIAVHDENAIVLR